MPPSVANKTTLKRINKEIVDIQKAQKSGEMGDILLQPDETNMHRWTGWLPGPPGSPYEGGHFEVAIELPKDYPLPSLDLPFLGLDTLKNNWSPALSIFKVMLSLSALLCEPNPDDPLVREIAMQWRKSRPEHDRKAAQLTKEQACSPANLAKRQRLKDGLSQTYGTAESSSSTNVSASSSAATASPRPSHALPTTTASGRPLAGSSRVASSTSLRTSRSASTNEVVDIIDLDGDDDSSPSAGTTNGSTDIRAGQRRRADGGDESGHGRRVRSRLSENATDGGSASNGTAAGSTQDELIILD
ncbi:hypothetical protein QFC22_001811 [Naganishia vaughanmartiniae]|uniref:Uncharacterized protein n=1 Tax=Naganishia vaughanmartiniae TaxID=1424756 RepID=A0ACC2XG24_9TREE|nr:hypothetical protein QFC22_001811 [Naganishia vaughanmartiniae]